MQVIITSTVLGLRTAESVFLFIVLLIFGNSGCISSDNTMISGLAGMWKGYLIISRYLAGGTEEIHAKPVRPRLEVGTSQYKSELLPLKLSC